MYVGIDYGRKRVGIAVSDSEGRMAFPQKVIEGGIEQVAKKLRELNREEPIEKIIIGLPFALDGKETEQTKETRKFAEKLQKKIKFSVEFENEMLTTRMAEKSGAAREYRDASAAALILQSYLDRIARTQNVPLLDNPRL